MKRSNRRTMIRRRMTIRRWKASGQALILIVLTFMGLMLFLGLMIDLGQIFLAKGYLRRAADAASLAAASQFRENRDVDDMIKAAYEAAHLNGIDPTSIKVQTCTDGVPGKDESLCSDVEHGEMPKKLVRVTIEIDYPLTFLSLLGQYSVRLVETSVSEAAAMDVVLVIDTSESMAHDSTDTGVDYLHDHHNPAVCNAETDPDKQCQPFRQVKDAAEEFATQILNKGPKEEEDRLSIVTFATGWQEEDKGTIVQMLGNWTNDQSAALEAIRGLKVYDPGPVYCPIGANWACPTGAACPDKLNDIPVGPCIYVNNENGYGGLKCARAYDIETTSEGTWEASFNPGAVSACNTTNIGGGLLLAGKQFEWDKRPEALWVVVLLTDGAANATSALVSDTLYGESDDLNPITFPLLLEEVIPHLPIGFCPSGTYDVGYYDINHEYCQDDNAREFKSPPTANEYDASDFAHDQGWFVGCPAKATSQCGNIKGQGAVIFTIGLGDLVLKTDPAGIPYGATLLRSIAAVGDDGDPTTDPCYDDLSTRTVYNKSCGNYFYAPTGGALSKVFEAIYSRIFTRLTQ
jgi:hypothetical protein